MAYIEEGTIEQITADDRNANDGSARGMALLEKSIGRNGLGRGTVVDKNKKTIGGNKTTEQAYAAGFEKVVFVHTKGDTLVVTVRDDLDLDDPTDPRARELAIADNRTGQVNLQWNAEELAAYEGAGIALREYFYEDELNALCAHVPVEQPPASPEDFKQITSDLPTEHKCPSCGYVWSGKSN